MRNIRSTFSIFIIANQETMSRSIQKHYAEGLEKHGDLVVN